MAKGRRRWTVRLVILGAVVWLIGWQGLGWLSGPGGEGAAGDAEAARNGDQAAPEEDRGDRSTGDEGTTAGGPVSQEGRGEDTAPSVGPAAGAASGPETSPVGGSTEDSVAARLRVLGQAVESGMLGGGFRALDELDGLSLGAARREEARQARVDLREHLDRGIEALRADVREGRLLAAHRRCEDLLRIPHPAVTHALAELERSQAWPSLRGGAPAEGYLPEPRPLPADRAVRFYRTGVEVRARVVDCTDTEVTVRLVDERGVTYPSLARTRVELPDATAAEAAEMGLAALHAGDALLARLWLCHGLVLGGGPRCRELAGLLG